jgi:hypothetical protein
MAWFHKVFYLQGHFRRFTEAAAAYRSATEILEIAYGADHEATETARINERAVRAKVRAL